MGLFDNIKDKAEDVKEDVEDAVDEAKDTAEDVVDEAKDRAGDAVEEAKDVVDEAKEGDVGGAVDEASDVGDAVTGGGGSSDSSGSSGSSSSGGSSGGGSSSGGSSSSGSSGGSGGSSSAERLRETLNQGNKDPDLPDDKKELEEAQEFREKNPILTKLQPGSEQVGQALEAREQGLEAKESVEQQEQQIRNAPENAVFEFKTGEGETKEFTKEEALDRVQEEESRIEEGLERQDQQFQRFIQAQNQDSGPVISEEQQKQIVQSNVDLDKEGQTNSELAAAEQPKFKQTRTDLGQPSPYNRPGENLEKKDRLGQLTDVFLSDKGGQLVASYFTDQKTPDEVLREEVAERKVENEMPSTIDRLQSPATLLIGGGAGGVAFKGATRAAATIGPRAAGAVEAAGIGLGAFETGKAAGEITQKASEGKTTEAGGQAVNFGATAAGFYGGAKAFNARFGARQGSTNIQQKNILRNQGDNIVGRGRFKADTNIVKPRIRDIVRKTKDPKRDVVTTEGQYRISGDQAIGNYRTKGPGGNVRNQGTFETVSTQRNTGETPSGQKFRETTDIQRFREEGLLFNNRREVTSQTRAIRQNQRDADQSDIAQLRQSFQDLNIRPDDVRVTDLATVSGEGNFRSQSFGNVRNFIVGRRTGRSGSSSSGTGQRTSSQSKSGEQKGFQAQVKDIVDSNADSFVSSQRSGANTVVSSSEQEETGQEGKGSQDESGQENIANLDSSLQASNITSQRQEDQGGNQESGRQENGQVTRKAKDLKDSITFGQSSDTTQGQDQGQRSFGATRQSQGQALGQRSEQELTNIQGQRNKLGLSQREGQKLGLSSKLESIQEIGLKNKQFQVGNLQLTGQRFSFGPSLSTRTGKGTAPGLEGQEGESFSTVSADAGRTADFQERTGVNLDWISENRVEQEGETASFVINEEALEEQRSLGGFRGIKAEEDQGRQNLDRNNSENNIW